MKRIARFFFRLAAVCLLPLAASCVYVFEWPAEDEEKGLYDVFLAFDADLPVWEQSAGRGETDGSSGIYRKEGLMRHTVQVHPFIDGEPALVSVETLSFTVDLSERDDYDCSFALRLAPGDYRVFVWSDFLENEAAEPYYQLADFSRIGLTEGPHPGSDDARDAFRGWADVHVDRNGAETRVPPSIHVPMQRPLAKFELVANDLAEFLTLEATRNSRIQGREMRTISLDNYTVLIAYVGYLPKTYSMLSDRPIDSAVGVSFASSLRETGDGEASLGFDYVLVKADTDQYVTVQAGIYDALDGSRVSQTGHIRIPLLRGRHTIVRGSFLMMDSSGGVGIDSDFDGDHNRDVGFTYTE